MNRIKIIKQTLAALGLCTLLTVMTGCGGAASGSSTSNSGSGNGGASGGSTSATVTLSWVAPTTRVDGSTPIALSEIEGYRIYYGNSPTNTNNSVYISGSNVNEYMITLQSGDYYFKISTYDANGIEGPKSSPIIVSI